MNNYDIVIVDSGVTLNNSNSVCGVCIKKTNEGFEYGDDLTDEIGHGTIIYSIIKKQVDTSKIFVIKLLECPDEYNLDCLITALEYVKKISSVRS